MSTTTRLNKADASTTAAAIHTTSDVADLDDAAKLVGDRVEPLDAALAARVKWKIDLFFVPTFLVGYGLVYYDKAILSSAVLFGMTKDLKLAVVLDATTKPPLTSTARLSWAVSIFYFGMLCGLYPMTLLVQRFRVGHVLAPLVVLWGGVAMLTAAVTSYQGLYAQRFFLGFIESVIPTTFMTIVSNYYLQKEQALRQGWWFCATGLWTIIGGALNYGFANITGGGLTRWQYIYLLAGSLTVLYGFFCFVIPDSPIDAWFLTKEERVAAVERLRGDQTGVRNHKIKLDHFKQAIRDVKFPLIFIMMASNYTVNGAVAGFGPLIVSTFGWTTLDSILWQFPVGAVTLIFVLLTGFLATRIRNIIIPQLLLCTLPTIAGCVMIWRSAWTYHAATPLVGYTLVGFFGPVSGLIIMSGMSNVAGATKKSLMAANIFVAYCLGNIVGPQLVKSQTKKRHYPELWLGLIICECICIITSTILYLYLRRENSRRDAQGLGDEKRDELSFRDLTDDENPYFRYVL